MAKRPKRPRDPAQLAKLIGDIATGQAQNVPVPPETPATEAPSRTNRATASFIDISLDRSMPAPKTRASLYPDRGEPRNRGLLVEVSLSSENVMLTVP